VIRWNWQTMFNDDPTLNERFGTRLMFAHKRARKIQDTLVRARLPNEPQQSLQVSSPLPLGTARVSLHIPTTRIPKYTGPCKHFKNCRTCPIITQSCGITSTVTGRTYPITTRITCDSKNVIYVITCA
jgi:hypothetical protein